jgi:hypothetical protein
MERYPYTPKNYPVYSGWLKTVVDSKWQLIVSEKLPTELYNWRSDLNETMDLARTKAGQDVIGNLRSELPGGGRKESSVVSHSAAPGLQEIRQ